VPACCGIVNLRGQGENPIIAASAVCNVPVSLFRDLGAVESTNAVQNGAALAGASLVKNGAHVVADSLQFQGARE
jgi:hypothetical protein